MKVVILAGGCGACLTEETSLMPKERDAKKDKFMTGSRVLIMSGMQLKEGKPDYIVIFPWSIQIEIIKHLAYIREWVRKFVVFIPFMRVI